MIFLALEPIRNAWQLQHIACFKKCSWRKKQLYCYFDGTLLFKMNHPYVHITYNTTYSIYQGGGGYWASLITLYLVVIGISTPKNVKLL